MTQAKENKVNKVNNPTEQEDKGSDTTSHDWGTGKGEEAASRQGKEAGRAGKEESKPYRTARDSTSVNPENQAPIDPEMPHMPPA